MKVDHLIVTFFFVVTLCFINVNGQFSSSSVHRCVHATRKLSKTGDGSTEESCMGCDPAKPDCFPGCQALIDNVYLRCDGICLPDGYYFDPQWEQEGCWENVKPALKVKIERCGCNSAFSTMIWSPVSQIVVAATIIFLFIV